MIVIIDFSYTLSMIWCEPIMTKPRLEVVRTFTLISLSALSKINWILQFCKVHWWIKTIFTKVIVIVIELVLEILIVLILKLLSILILVNKLIILLIHVVSTFLWRSILSWLLRCQATLRISFLHFIAFA
jgi:hypothetical protein